VQNVIGYHALHRRQIPQRLPLRGHRMLYICQPLPLSCSILVLRSEPTVNLIRRPGYPE
jgi:hypothetical protein